jgi:hypothetical protein
MGSSQELYSDPLHQYYGVSQRLQHDAIMKNKIQTSIPVTESGSAFQINGDYKQLYTEILILA